MGFRKFNATSVILLMLITFMIGYGFITLQDNQIALESKDHEIVKRRDHESVLQEQLKVVYHHAQRVEEELKKERERHKDTRYELLRNKKEFFSNITKAKHEAWTRFNALDSDHKMLKAEHEETKIGLSSLQAQYKRLSSDHQRIVKQNKEDFQALSDSKERESLSLQDRIQELYKKNTFHKQLADKNEEYYLKIKEHFTNCTKISEGYRALLQKQIDDKKKSRQVKDEPTELIKLHNQLNELQNKKLELSVNEEKVKINHQAETTNSQPTSNEVETTEATTEKSHQLESRGIDIIKEPEKAEENAEKNAELPPNNRYEGKRQHDRYDSTGQDSASYRKDRRHKMTFNHRMDDQSQENSSKDVLPRHGASKGKRRPMQPIMKRMNHDKRSQLKTPMVIQTSQMPSSKESDLKSLELLETPPPSTNNVFKVKGDSPILKPIADRKNAVPLMKGDEEKLKEERMDVKKVTLEDDENGDQNLDKNGEPGDEIGNEAEENGKEEDEGMEEKLPNILVKENEK